MKYWNSGPNAWWVASRSKFEAMKSLPPMFQNLLLERMMPSDGVGGGSDVPLEPGNYLMDFN